MAVAFLNTGTMVQTATASYSGAFSVNTGGTNVAAFAVIAYDNSGHSAGAVSISSVTYGGNTMTSCGTRQHNANGAGYDQYAEAYYLVNPPTGSNTLAVTFTGTGFNEGYINLVAFQGVDQTTPVRASTYAGANGTSLTVTSNASDRTVTVACGDGGGISGTNQTSDGTNNNGSLGAGSDHCTTAASSVTHTWSGSTTAAIIGFSVQAASGGGGGTVAHLLTLMGCGA